MQIFAVQRKHIFYNAYRVERLSGLSKAYFSMVDTGLFEMFRDFSASSPWSNFTENVCIWLPRKSSVARLDRTLNTVVDADCMVSDSALSLRSLETQKRLSDSQTKL